MDKGANSNMLHQLKDIAMDYDKTIDPYKSQLLSNQETEGKQTSHKNNLLSPPQKTGHLNRELIL